MTNLDLEVLDIIRKSLMNEKIEQISNWNVVLKELKDQSVFCLPYSLLKKSDLLSTQEKMKYQALCMKSVSYNVQLLREQSKLVHLFEENNIPFVVLKGSAASMYYLHPEYRTMGDIDLIVKPEDYKRASNLMHENYKFIKSNDVSIRHESFLTSQGFDVELHRYFSFGKTNKKKRMLDKMIYKGIDRREIHSIQNYSFPTLPPVENGLVLLNHIYQHLYNGGIGYRQVIDYREFINCNKELVEEFLEASDVLGLRCLAEVMITICNKYLGLDVKCSFKFEQECLNLEEELLEKFVTSGNFGSKEVKSEERRTESVIKDLRNPFYAIVQMQVYGLKNWEASKKYSILKPFAWIYQLIRYVKHSKKYGGISGVLKGSKRISDKNQLFKELKLPKNY